MQFSYIDHVHRCIEFFRGTSSIESLRMLASGDSVTGVARQVNWIRRTITNLQQCYNVTGTMWDHPGAGRPQNNDGSKNKMGK